MTERFKELLQWLENTPQINFANYTQPVSASADASFRSYYRIEKLMQKGIGSVAESPNNCNNCNSLIIMDAPPLYEDCSSFIKVTEHFLQLGLNVPKIIAQNLDKGFLLLTDLGTTTFLSILDENNVESLYEDAFDALVTLQSKGTSLSQTLPEYNANLLQTEINLFPDWFLQEHLNIDLKSQNYQTWLNTSDLLVKNALKQPKTYVHRDFHSRNLMITTAENNTGNNTDNNPGILDYQDAVSGALTYDAVSLLRDCYIVWPAEQVKEWQRQYFLKLCTANVVTKSDWQGFVQSMDWMGIQRHLKAAGIFARLNYRDGKDGYMNDIPATLNYISSVASQYKELKYLTDLVERIVLPKFV